MQEQQQEEKNYYIVIPVTTQNIVNVYSFIENTEGQLGNIGNNCNTLQVIPNPINPLFPCYQFELKESLVVQYQTQLDSLGSEVYGSAEAYLTAYPIVSDNQIL